MTFRITTEPLDAQTALTPPEPFTAYKLRCVETGEFICIIPQFGGILHQLVLRKDEQLVSLLKTPDSTEAILADDSYASAFLFPFASRIPEGIYSFEGQEYVLPINEVGFSNAIHGLIHRQVFSVVGQETTDEKAGITLRHDYQGDLSGYPFPFAFLVTYELAHTSSTPSDSCTLSIRYAITNTGTRSCPVGFGWHPYFTLGSEPVDELIMTLPARSEVILNEDLQPCGYEQMVAAETIQLRDRQLDNVYALTYSEQGFAETVLSSSNTNIQLVVGQETSAEKLAYLICYTPPERDCIAIEPQTANVNAFNNGDGLVTLNPGNELTGTMWVRLL